MSARVVQVNYDTLSEVAVEFDHQSAEVETMTSRLVGAIDVLRGGNWAGTAADAFYREMDDELLPTLQLLQEAFEDGRIMLKEFSTKFDEVETEAAGLFGDGQGNKKPVKGQGTVDLFNVPPGMTNARGITNSYNNWGDYDNGSGDYNGVSGNYDKGEGHIPWYDVELPIGLQVGMGVVPFVDLIDIMREVAKKAKGEDADELVLSMATLGLLADLGWISPEPITEIPNVLLSLGKVMVKGVPAGPTRDAIAAIIMSAAKNADDNPGELLRLAKVAGKLLAKPRLLEELIIKPDALLYTLRQGEGFLDRLARENLPHEEAVTLIDHMSRMGRASIPSGDDLRPKYLLDSSYDLGYDGVAMEHFLEHTWDYVDPGKRIENMIREDRPIPTTLWPQGTSASDIADYLDEALHKLSAENRLPRIIDETTPQKIELDNGVWVMVGSREIRTTGEKIIGQFYPIEGQGLTHISANEMDIIYDLLE